jgi:thioredoxin-like negative regulator of GroEL
MNAAATADTAALPPTDSDWQVICLCADWCGTCREWRPQLAEVARAHPGVRFAWVDIEDEADAVGDVDIETFPTLLIAGAGTPRFLGPVLPHAGNVERLLASLQQDERALAVPPEAAGLLQRLQTIELELI